MQQSDEKAIKLIKTLGEVVKDYRNKSGKTIYRISAESAVSKATWREVEIAACKDLNFTTFWKIAEGLEITPEELISALKKKLGEDFSLIEE